MLSEKDKQMLLDKIDNEGFDYCFLHYSSWKEVKDKKFHELRKAFVDAASALEKYIGTED